VQHLGTESRDLHPEAAGAFVPTERNEAVELLPARGLVRFCAVAICARVQKLRTWFGGAPDVPAFLRRAAWHGVCSWDGVCSPSVTFTPTDTTNYTTATKSATIEVTAASATDAGSDFNGDGKPDVLWRNTTTGENIIWYLNNAAYVSYAWVLTVADLDWKIGQQQ
jgi:hypothetical protein